MLKPGQVVEGLVEQITSYGLFIDLGDGLKGLLLLHDMSWGRPPWPLEDHFEVGQPITTQVLKWRDTSGVLSLKQLQPDPWLAFTHANPPNSQVKGKVVGILDYGVFVELAPMIEGLLHISDMGISPRPSHPNTMFSVGDEIACTLLDADAERRKIRLGFDASAPNKP